MQVSSAKQYYNIFFKKGIINFLSLSSLNSYVRGVCLLIQYQKLSGDHFRSIIKGKVLFNFFINFILCSSDELELAASWNGPGRPCSVTGTPQPPAENSAESPSREKLTGGENRLQPAVLPTPSLSCSSSKVHTGQSPYL